MDTSKEYILMCEKAVDIQKIRDKFYLGDYGSDGRGWFLFRDNEPMPRGGFIFLPRQDQLQEVVFNKIEGNCDGWTHSEKLRDFNEYFLDFATDKINCEKHPSLEQLWLAFVMHEKYNKIWNGEDWVQEVGDE